MANDKVYPNYLMHYRTKGSKNGYSKSKYYTPVGQKAKGRWVNGKYVYDGKNSYELGTYEKNHQGLVNGKRQSWQQIGNSYRAANEAAQKAGEGKSRFVDINGTGFNQRWEASNRYKNAANKTVIKNMVSEGSKNAWQQQANYQKEKDKKRNDAIAKGAKNNWQQMANLSSAGNRYVNDAVQKKVGDEWSTDGMLTSERRKYEDEMNRSGLYTDQKRTLDKDGHIKWDNSYSNALKRKEHAANKAHSDYLMKNTKSAMGNDPRYSDGLRTVYNSKGKKILVNMSHTPYTQQIDKYDYSKDPYFSKWANATNAQEEAKALAKKKEFMNDFRTSKIRNSRSDIGNAIADAKEDAKKKWRDIKKSAKKTASKIGKKGKSLVEKFKNLFK